MFQYLEGWSTVSIPILSAWSAPIPLAHASFISLAHTTIHLRTLRLACAHRPTFSSWKIVCTFGVFRDFEEEEESLSVQSDHHVEVREREDRVAVLPRYVSLVPLHSLRERGRDLGAGLEAGDFLVFPLWGFNFSVSSACQLTLTPPSGLKHTKRKQKTTPSTAPPPVSGHGLKSWHSKSAHFSGTNKYSNETSEDYMSWCSMLMPLKIHTPFADLTEQNPAPLLFLSGGFFGSTQLTFSLLDNWGF